MDEALREDAALAAFHRYKKPVGIGLLVGAAALGGGLWWTSQREGAVENRAERFTLALDQLDAGDAAQAAQQLVPLAAPAEEGGGAAAARLMRASIAEQRGDKPGAARLYAAVAADGNAPQPFRDLATVRGTALGFDSLPPAEVVRRLHPLAAPGNPWFGSAGELTAMAYLKQGRTDLAATMFAAIAKDPAAPDTLRARSRQIAGLLGQDTLDDAAVPAPEAR